MSTPVLPKIEFYDAIYQGIFYYNVVKYEATGSNEALENALQVYFLDLVTADENRGLA